MVGNVGGYIGLCLGYSILQVPDIILWVIRKVRKYFSGMFTTKPGISPRPINITEEEPGEIKIVNTRNNDIETVINIDDSENSDK